MSKKLIGNEKILDMLNNNFKNNKLSNSLIIYGPKGMGKATLIYNFIFNTFKDLYFNKIDQTNLIYNNSHPNIKYIEKQFDDKNKLKNNISIDQIRNLENFLNQTSFDNLPKFVIIDSADDLNINSSNSLLKNLEESKKNTYFFLITHQLSNILPTIRSRCSKICINKPNFEQFTEIFKLLNKDIQKNNLNFLYEISNGSPGLALQIYSAKINHLYENIFNILNKNNNFFKSEIINLSNSVNKFSNDEFKIFLTILKFILMNILKSNLGVKVRNMHVFDFENIDFTKINIENSLIVQILEYLNFNEIDLFKYNLDKKIFCLNIFTPIQKFYE